MALVSLSVELGLTAFRSVSHYLEGVQDQRWGGVGECKRKKHFIPNFCMKGVSVYFKGMHALMTDLEQRDS